MKLFELFKIIFYLEMIENNPTAWIPQPDVQEQNKDLVFFQNNEISNDNCQDPFEIPNYISTTDSIIDFSNAIDGISSDISSDQFNSTIWDNESIDSILDANSDSEEQRVPNENISDQNIMMPNAPYATINTAIDVISDTSIFIPCITRIDNNEDNQPSQISFHKRKRKRKVDLNEKQQIFQKEYYKFFTSKKKFSKKYVIELHKLMKDELNLRPMSREETRQIGLYFQNFASEKSRIFEFFTNNMDACSSLFKK